MLMARQTRSSSKRFSGRKRSGPARTYPDYDGTTDFRCLNEKKLITPCASHTLLFNIDHSDCTFYIQDADSTTILETIPVHKILLSAGSEMFNRMFLSDMSECHTGVVTITDFSSEVVKEMLRFIYCGYCDGPIVMEHADRMVMIAQKYIVKHMVDYLEQFFVLHINKHDSLSTIWSLSQTWSMRNLERAVLKHIKENPRRHLNDHEFRHSLDLNSLQKMLSAVAGLSENFISDNESEKNNGAAEQHRTDTKKTMTISEMLARVRYAADENAQSVGIPDGDGVLAVTALHHNY